MDADTLRRSAAWTPVSLVESVRGSGRRLVVGQASRIPAGLARPTRCGLTKSSRMRGFPTSASCAPTQRRLSPAEAEASIADHAGGGRVGELARIYGIRRTTVPHT